MWEARPRTSRRKHQIYYYLLFYLSQFEGIIYIYITLGAVPLGFEGFGPRGSAFLWYIGTIYSARKTLDRKRSIDVSQADATYAAGPLTQ